MAFIRITGLRMGSNYPFAPLQPGQAAMSHQAGLVRKESSVFLRLSQGQSLWRD